MRGLRASLPDLRTVLALGRVEFRAALRQRWLLLYAAVFVVLMAGVVLASGSGVAALERGRFGRSAAALTNVVLLTAPLVGLVTGAVAVVADRERGLLAYVLAQPVTTAEVFLGKYLGGAAALACVLGAGFAAAAAALAFAGAIEFAGFAWLAGLALLLALGSFSVGLLLSTLARGTALALGAGVIAWVTLLFLGDLGLMATALTTRLDIRLVVWSAVANPAEAFKVAAIHQIDASLEALGPAGIYLVERAGGALLPLLIAVLLAWIVVPAALALLRLQRTDAA